MIAPTVRIGALVPHSLDRRPLRGKRPCSRMMLPSIRSAPPAYSSWRCSPAIVTGASGRTRDRPGRLGSTGPWPPSACWRWALSRWCRTDPRRSAGPLDELLVGQGTPRRSGNASAGTGPLPGPARPRTAQAVAKRAVGVDFLAANQAPVGVGDGIQAAAASLDPLVHEDRAKRHAEHDQQQDEKGQDEG